MASQNPPKTLNGITYDDKHLSMHRTYNSTEDVRMWSANHFSGIDGYQRFIRLANIQPGESVLDVACGTGLVGLLACEVLGANHSQVYFVDYSQTMLEKARTEVKRRYRFPDANFQRVDDIRSPAACTAFKDAMGKPGGFDVVLVRLFLNHFTLDTQHAAIRHLLTLLAPGSESRLVIDWGVPSASRAFRGDPADQTVVGMRKTIISHVFGQVEGWIMGFELNTPSFTTLVSTGDRQRGREWLQRIVEGGGGRLVAWQEVFDRTGSNNISSTIVERARVNGEPPGQNPRVQQDWERRLEVNRIEGGQPSGAAMLLGVEFSFRLMFTLAAVVKK